MKPNPSINNPSAARPERRRPDPAELADQLVLEWGDESEMAPEEPHSIQPSPGAAPPAPEETAS